MKKSWYFVLALIIVGSILFIGYKRYTINAAKPAFVIITVDCLRPDHLSCYGYERKTSPYIDSLGENGIIFKNAYTPGLGTPTAMTSYFTSFYFSVHRRAGMEILPEQTITLAEKLDENNYATAFFGRNLWLKKKFGLGQGFDVYDDFEKEVVNIEQTKNLSNKTNNSLKNKDQNIYDLNNYKNIDNVWIPKGKLVNDHVLSWVKANSSDPIFLWIHYMDVHDPYTGKPFTKTKDIINIWDFQGNKIVNQYYKNLRSVEEKEKFRRDFINYYDGEISYCDKQIRSLLSKLKEIISDREIYIFILSDHGEQFFERGKFIHGFQFNESIRIPLILHILNKQKGNNYPLGLKVENPVSGMDIMPTILDIAKIDHPPFIQGRSLLEALNKKDAKHRPLFTEGEKYDQYKTYSLLVHNNIKYIVNFKRKVDDPNRYIQDYTEELYDLINDPEEKNNLIGQENLVLVKLRNMMKQHLTECDQIREKYLLKTRKEKFSAKEKKELKALGYLQ